MFYIKFKMTLWINLWFTHFYSSSRLENFSSERLKGLHRATKLINGKPSRITGHRKHQLYMPVVHATIISGTEVQRGFSPALIDLTDSSTLNKCYKVLQWKYIRSPMKAPKECHNFSGKGQREQTFIGEMSSNEWEDVHAEGLGSVAQGRGINKWQQQEEAAWWNQKCMQFSMAQCLHEEQKMAWECEK